MEVCNHPIFQWSDRDNIPWRSTQHPLGFNPDGGNRPLCYNGADCDDRRLIQYNSLPFDVDQRIRCPQVDRNIVRKQSAYDFKHASCILLGVRNKNGSLADPLSILKPYASMRDSKYDFQ